MFVVVIDMNNDRYGGDEYSSVVSVEDINSSEDNELTLKENKNINKTDKNNNKKIRIDLAGDNYENISAFIVVNNPDYLIENNIVNRNNSINIEDIMKGAGIGFRASIDDITTGYSLDYELLLDVIHLTEKIEEYNEIRKDNNNNNEEKINELDEEIRGKIDDINKEQIELSYNSKENGQSATKKLNLYSISYSELDSNNLKQNKGIIYYYNGDKYEGEFKKDKINGNGIYYASNGDIYKGEFKNDMIEGKGIHYSNDGSRYEGEFKNGMKEGKGIHYSNDGDIYEGEFRKDKFDGKGIFYCNDGGDNDGDIEIREYSNDEYIKTILYYSKADGKIYNKRKSVEDKIEINNSNISTIEGGKYKKDYKELKKRVYREKYKKQYPLLYEIIRTCEEDNCDNNIRYKTIEDDDPEAIKQQYRKDDYIIQRKRKKPKQNVDDDYDNYSFYIQSNKNNNIDRNKRFGVIIYRPREDAQTFLNNFKSRTTVDTDILEDNDRFILLGYTTDYFGRFDTTLSELNTIKEKLENGKALSGREKNRLDKLSMVQQKMGLVRGNEQYMGRG